MKITFIRLNMFEHISSDAMKPIIFEIIRGITPAEHEIEFIDERVEKLPDKINSDIVAFSVETFTAKRAYILAKKYRTDKNIIVMGGFHAAVMADEMLEYADSVIIGDAEGAWGRFISDCSSGMIQKKYFSDENEPVGYISPHPEVYSHKYFHIGVHQISRGCKFNCGFCSIKTMYKCVRRKTIADTVRELNESKERIVFFADDNLLYDRKSAMKLFEAITPLKKMWACQISMDAAKDDELLAAMKRSGCFLVLMGFESLNSESLEEMNKSANIAADYEKIIKRVYSHGLLIYGTFVLGCDGDYADVFQKTYNFAVRNSIAVTNFNPLIPMPGTPVYEHMELEGRLRYKKWWLSDVYRYGETAFIPKNMTPEQLSEGCLRIRRDFYSLRCIFRRLFGCKSHLRPHTLLVFLLANFISRREINKKQGQLLGGILNEADADKT